MPNRAVYLLIAAIFVYSSPHCAFSQNGQVKEYGGNGLIRSSAQPTPAFDGQHEQIKEYGNAKSHSQVQTSLNTITDSAFLRQLESSLKEKSPRKFLGQVTVEFRLLPNGKIDHLQVARSSGMPQIDNTASDAIKSSSPFSLSNSKVPRTVRVLFVGTSADTAVQCSFVQ